MWGASNAAAPSWEFEFGYVDPISLILNRSNGGKIKMVGFDAGSQSVADLKKGDVQGLVVQNPVFMGYKAVMTLVDAPVIPAPVRLAQTSMTGSLRELWACAALAVSPASANTAPQIFSFIPMTQFLRLRPAKLSASGETKSDAKDRQTPNARHCA